jgi:hypothetical protein
MPRFVTLRFAPPKSVPAKLLLRVALLLVFAFLVSCGGNKSSITGPPTPNIAGAWEFVAVSNTTDPSSNKPYVTGIEVALKEGQVLVNGIEEPDGQITASGTQIAFVSVNPNSTTNVNITGFGGACQPITTANSLAGSITAPNAPINFTFTENGNVFNVTATLSGDGQSVLNGTYTAQTENTCPDAGGTITGYTVPKILSNTYAGQICQPTSSSCTDLADTVTATVSESSSGTLTLNLAFTAGPDAGTNFTMQGPVTGNAFSVSGTFAGVLVTYYGYYEVVGTTQSLYFVNAADAAQPVYAGTLAQVVTP